MRSSQRWKSGKRVRLGERGSDLCAGKRWALKYIVHHCPAIKYISLYKSGWGETLSQLLFSDYVLGDS